MLEENDNNQQDVGSSVASAVGQMDRMIPKLCTNIQVEIVNDKHIVLTMLYAENTKQIALIERITIDIEHAKKLSEILNEAVRKI